MPERNADLSWLIALTREALGGAPAGAPPANLAGEAFPALVERHRLSAFLVQRAGPTLARHLPADALDRMRHAAAATVQRALVVAAAQRRLLKAIEGAGIKVVAVKGLLLAQTRYGGIGRRHVGDVDLLVQPADVPRADAALRALGLRRTRPDFELTPRQTSAYLNVKPEFEYVDPHLGLRVELLWRLEGLRQPAAAWPARRVPFAGTLALTLPVDVEVVYLMQHGARHGWFRLFWLVDAALLLGDPTIDWPAIMMQAKAQDAERALMQAAALAEQVLDIPCPAALAPGGQARKVRKLVAEARRQLRTDPGTHGQVREWARQLAYRTQLQRTPAGKWHVLAPHIISPQTWSAVRLPDRWFFLYPVLTPLLWLLRRLTRKP